jgi:hypothetical protein
VKKRKTQMQGAKPRLGTPALAARVCFSPKSEKQAHDFKAKQRLTN